MRKYTLELGGREIVLGITWAAGQEIADKVADPLAIIADAQVRSLSMQAGLTPPKGGFQWTGKTVADVLFIGVKHSGEQDTISIDEVRELVFDAGLDNSHAAALLYIGNMANPDYDTAVAKAAKRASDTSGE